MEPQGAISFKPYLYPLLQQHVNSMYVPHDDKKQVGTPGPECFTKLRNAMQDLRPHDTNRVGFNAVMKHWLSYVHNVSKSIREADIPEVEKQGESLRALLEVAKADGFQALIKQHLASPFTVDQSPGVLI